MVAIASLKGSEDLSFSLYSKLNQQEKDIVFSPYSIFTCLAMPYMGARGSTEAAMKSALQISLSKKELAASIASTMSSYSKNQKNDVGYQLQIANAVWIAENFSVLPDFRLTLKDNFQADIQPLNFNEPKNAAETINHWVSLQTEGHVPTILSPSDLSAATRLILANTIYFKGSWQHPFNTHKTASDAFWTDSHTHMEADFMEQTAHLPYYESAEFQALALPLIKKDQSADIVYLMVLPKNDHALSSEDFKHLISSLKSTQVHVKCPKFVLDKAVDLKPILSALGMDIAFTDKADFSGINGKHDLYIDKILHRTFFSVDEAGLTAAAATAIAIFEQTALEPRTPPIEFIANRPFLFFLVDMNTKTPLFMGKLNKPTCDT